MKQTSLFEPPPQSGPIGAVDRWAAGPMGRTVLGVDEAGRGPLAGPVVAGCVILHLDDVPRCFPDLNDSKKMSESRRDVLFDLIRERAHAHGVGIVSAEVIDDINILEATRRAMHLSIQDCLKGSDISPDVLLIDGHLALPGYRGEQWPLVKGDSRSWSIAAGSILAKVTRDRLMKEYEERYPGYGFAQHKGYGTVHHRTAMAALGLSPIHRRSFKWRVPDEEQKGSRSSG